MVLPGERGAGRPGARLVVQDVWLNARSAPISTAVPRCSLSIKGAFPVSLHEDLGEKLGGGHLLPRQLFGFC